MGDEKTLPEPATYSVMCYEDASTLDGEPTAELVRESLRESPTGAVPAYRDEAGAWQYVAPSDIERMRRLGHAVRTVYCEE